MEHVRVAVSQLGGIPHGGSDHVGRGCSRLGRGHDKTVEVEPDPADVGVARTDGVLAVPLVASGHVRDSCLFDEGDVPVAAWSCSPIAGQHVCIKNKKEVGYSDVVSTVRFV